MLHVKQVGCLVALSLLALGCPSTPEPASAPEVSVEVGQLVALPSGGVVVIGSLTADDVAAGLVRVDHEGNTLTGTVGVYGAPS